MSLPVAITGLGVVSPAGEGAPALWHALEGRADLLGPWPRRRLDAYPVGGVVAVPEDVWAAAGARGDRPAERSATLAARIVDRALAEAGLADGGAPGRRLGCFLATTTAGVEAAEADRAVPGTATPNAEELDGSAAIPRRAHPWTGPTAMISTACSSGLMAPALAIDALAAGEADVMVAGGLDILLEYTVCGFNGLRLASPDRCRPFAAERRGAVLGEGGAAVCLEPLDAALARGAPVRAVVTGYGMSCDAGHATAPDPAGIARAVRAALAAADAQPADIGGVLAHATGTKANDGAEIAALREAFGDAALPPVTGVKSILGHAQAGAGALALAAAVLALEHGALPPTAGVEAPDPALGAVDVVVGPGRAPTARALMVNAFGFGGNNCVMIVAGAESAAASIAGPASADAAAAACGG